MTTATLSRLTLPESAAACASVTVWWPAVRSIGTRATAQVSQSAVTGRLTVRAVPPSTVNDSVRVVFLPSPPSALAYRASNS